MGSNPAWPVGLVGAAGIATAPKEGTTSAPYGHCHPSTQHSMQEMGGGTSGELGLVSVPVGWGYAERNT